MYNRLLTPFIVAFLFSTVLFSEAFAQRKPASRSNPPTPMVSKTGLTDEQIQSALDEAYARFKDLKEGANADYIKELARVDRNIFGIALITVDGKVFTKGDLQSQVSIQSISKVFTLARVIDEMGPKAIQEKVGVDATGMRFNSIIAVELNKGKEMNPCVNPGAIATTSLIQGIDSAAKWRNVLATHSAFAGRNLTVDMPVYVSEAGDNQRNLAIAELLKAYGRMYFDPREITDVYTKQCAISVNAKDLAAMGATLANGGVNPLTQLAVVKPETVPYTLAVMSTAGLYDDAGQWLYNVGLPAKSGVGGGIVAVSPGKFGIAVIAPPLDAAGNSVKAKLAIEFVVKKLNANPYAVKPLTASK